MCLFDLTPCELVLLAASIAIAFSQDLDLSKKYLTDENGNKIVDKENNKLNTFI